MDAIKTCLWFDNQALEAAEYYVDVFGDAEITDVTHYATDAAPGDSKVGDVVLVEFRIGTQQFEGVNGGPAFTFDEAVSVDIRCSDQAEVDRLWDRFIADGGTESQCGWLSDKYGFSWQIAPSALGALLNGPAAKEVTEAMLKMSKIDLPALEAVAAGAT